MHWQADLQPEGPGLRCQLLQESKYLSFRRLFRLLECDSRFAGWYSALLADCGMDAFFWEHPALTSDRLDRPVEFVLLPAPMLARMSAEPGPFTGQFVRQPGKECDRL